MKIFLRFISILVITFLLGIGYLSIFGIETKKFNNQIKNKIKNINNEVDIELKKVKLKLNLLKFQIKAKTIGPKLINRNKFLNLENIKTQVSLKSLLNGKFSIENLEISTQSIEIDNLISFVRSIKQIPELFVLEKIFKIKGYIIADVKLEFDDEGNIKDNFTARGFIKDTKLKLLKEHQIDNINFVFNLKKNKLIFEDINFSFNKLDFKSEKISSVKRKDVFTISGNIDNDDIELNQKNIDLFTKNLFPNLNIKKLKFISNNNFIIKIDEKFKLKDTYIDSKINIKNLKILKDFKFKKFFPLFKNEIELVNNEINLKYKNDSYSLKGSGDVIIQKERDYISYLIEKNNKSIKFNNFIEIKENPLLIEFLNYQKKDNQKASIDINGYINKKNQIILNSLLFREKDNQIKIKNLKFDNKFKIIDLDKIDLNYLDKNEQKNLIKIIKKNNDYTLNGSFFNADNLIENILTDNKGSFDIFKKNFKMKVNINKVRLDNEYNLNNFSGNLFFKDQKIHNANLSGDFPKNKKMKFTVKSNGSTKSTTLFLDHAKPIVNRYKFIKGFDEGILDFYSTKNGDESNSQLKIYNFKLKELPTLTKILTLASLQGIADILSGEGIRFDEFEMNFKNKKKLMTIEEIYAIGPAISILMNGYVEKDKLVSLRGTLVPATTINKAIGSIPVLGKILVGSKTGEGVFGVSFKIKGPPKNLETTVNPIKTLTPRFITRTLENIKKN